MANLRLRRCSCQEIDAASSIYVSIKKKKFLAANCERRALVTKKN